MPHVAGPLQGVRHGLRPVVEAVLDTRGQDVADPLAQRGLVPLVDDVATQGQRQAVILAAPPDSEVFTHHQAFVGVGQLAFVDDESDIGHTRLHGLENLIKGHHH